MDIYLVNNDVQTEYIIVPVVPSEIKIYSPMSNQKYETATSEINLYGNEMLKTLSLSSFFPKVSGKYVFDKGILSTAMDYVNLIEKWKQEKIIVVVAIFNGSMEFIKNMLIENFEYGIQDGSGDIYYTLNFSEYVTINLEQKVL